MVKNNNHSVFPPSEELEKVCQRAKKSDRWTNIGLTPWTTELDKAKYKLCKDILRYEQRNNLTTENIAKQLELSIYRTEYILYSHIDKLTLDELVGYANKLGITTEIKIPIPYGQKVAPQAR